MDSGREETTSQREEVVSKERAVSLDELKGITEKRVDALNELIKKYSFPTDDPELLQKEVPFRECDYHFFMTEIMKLRRDLEALRYSSYTFTAAAMEHAVSHATKAEQNAGAIARINAGEAVLEMLEKIDESENHPSSNKHLHN